MLLKIRYARFFFIPTLIESEIYLKTFFPVLEMKRLILLDQ